MKNSLVSFLLVITLSNFTHAQHTFSIKDKTDQAHIEEFFNVLRESNTIYIKNGKITQQWLALSTKFKTKLISLKKNISNFEIVPHTNIFDLPPINLDEDKENDFKKALAKIDPVSEKVYSCDASLIKRAFYALVHNHFVVVKKGNKYILVFGTQCKNEAQASALDTTKTRNVFLSKMSYWLKAKIALLITIS